MEVTPAADEPSAPSTTKASISTPSFDPTVIPNSTRRPTPARIVGWLADVWPLADAEVKKLRIAAIDDTYGKNPVGGWPTLLAKEIHAIRRERILAILGKLSAVEDNQLSIATKVDAGELEPPTSAKLPTGVATYVWLAFLEIIAARAQAEEADRLAQLEEVRQKGIALFAQVRGERYANCTLDNYRAATDAQRNAIGKIRGIVDNALAGQPIPNVLLTGSAGVGKDHMLAGAVRRLLDSGEWSYVRATVGERSAIKELTWFSGAELAIASLDSMHKGTLRKLIDDLSSIALITVSDPGAEAGWRDHARNAWYEIVDRRYSHCLPTWVTANGNTRKELEQMLGSRAYDRLRHGAVCINCRWASYRRTADELNATEGPSCPNQVQPR